MKVRVHHPKSNEPVAIVDLEELFEPDDDEIAEARATLEKMGSYVMGGGEFAMYWITLAEEPLDMTSH